jgi:hypothetical protein
MKKLLAVGLSALLMLASCCPVLAETDEVPEFATEKLDLFLKALESNGVLVDSAEIVKSVDENGKFVSYEVSPLENLFVGVVYVENQQSAFSLRSLSDSGYAYEKLSEVFISLLSIASGISAEETIRIVDRLAADLKQNDENEMASELEKDGYGYSLVVPATGEGLFFYVYMPEYMELIAD